MRGLGQPMISQSAIKKGAAHVVTPQLARQMPESPKILGDKPPVPSYVWWMASAFVLGGAVAFASKKGWLRRLKR